MYSVTGVQQIRCWELSLSIVHQMLSDDVLEEGLDVGPDLLGLGAVEVPEDALGPVVGQHRLRVRLHQSDYQIKTPTSLPWPDKRKQCCGSKLFIPDPDPNFFFSGSRAKKIPGSTSTSKDLGILTQKIVSKLSEIWSGMFIPDPDAGSGSLFLNPYRIPNPGSKRHRIPEPQHWENGKQKLIYNKFARTVFIKLCVLSRGLGFLID